MRERWSKMMSKLPYRGKGWARSRGAADVRGLVVEGALEFVPDRRHVGKPPARCVIPGMPRPSRRGPIWCCVFVLRSVVFEECCFWGSIGLLRGISKRTQKKSVRVPFQRRVATEARTDDNFWVEGGSERSAWARWFLRIMIGCCTYIELGGRRFPARNLATAAC